MQHNGNISSAAAFKVSKCCSQVTLMQPGQYCVLKHAKMNYRPALSQLMESTRMGLWIKATYN